MRLYRDRLLPVLVDLGLSGKDYQQVRARVAAGLSGEVLEIGFGSGRNLPHYPAGVRGVQAIEPAAGGRRLAAKRVAASPVRVEYVGVDGESLPADDNSVDHVLVTWTLCTIPDVARALAEVRRVLRPGGGLHFAEHGLSPDPAVARWQGRLTPIQRRIAGGCHLDRPIDRLIDESGLHVASLQNYLMPGPKAFSYMFEGVAIKE